MGPCAKGVNGLGFGATCMRGMDSEYGGLDKPQVGVRPGGLGSGLEFRVL